MSGVYFNENDPYPAAWLRNLYPAARVDDRSIIDVQPHDLALYHRCHFFGGIGGWEYALALAGWDPTRPVWTGSCPCQPFSAAGKRGGQADDRHLWPAWFRLIRECRPDTIFGEQVEAAIRMGWLDGVFRDLEGEGYTCGAVVLGAHSVGAPHIRQRIYWVATRPDGLGDPRQSRLAGWQSIPGDNGAECASVERASGDAYWSDYTLILCLDGKTRRTQPGLFPLAYGVPFRLADGRTREDVSRKDALKGIGNAIVPQVAAEFIRAFLESEVAG